MPSLRKAAQRRTPSRYSTAPATIADLSPDVLLRTLALTGQPARYASVCKTWNDLLAGSTEVWKECVLTSKHCWQPPKVIVETGRMLGWLLERCQRIEAITFKKFAVTRYPQGIGSEFVPFFAAAMGMLAGGSPLRVLRFENCMLAPNLLPQVQLLTSCTALHLHEVANVDGSHLQLSELLQAMPQLRELAATYYSSNHECHALPSGLAACGRLQSCHLTDLRNNINQVQLSDSIGSLTSLTTLCLCGISVHRISAKIGQLPALQTLRILASPSDASILPPLQLPARVGQLAASLRRLSFCSKAVPAELTALQSLSRLSIGGLAYDQEVGAQVARLSVLTNIARLRLHRCTGLRKTGGGLTTLLNALPKLKALALDHNIMVHTSLGEAAKRLTSLDLRGSAYHQEGLPTALRRAVNCRKLQLSVASWDALTQGGAYPMSSCPLLSMTSLQLLVLQQSSWPHDAVTAVLALQRCFHESSAISGSGPKVVCPFDWVTVASYALKTRLADSSDDEDDV